MKSANFSKLEHLLNPESVAVYGVSRTPGKVGHEIFANLVKGKFSGELIPVNPSADEVLGVPCVSSLRTSGHKVDLSVIAVPMEYVHQAIEDSLAAGVKAVTVITAGFKEVDKEGAKREAELVQLCHTRGVRMLGPNCLGIINTHHRLNASFAKHMPAQGGISVLSQSGALCTSILDWAAARHVGLAKLVSIGNKADLSEIDLLQALAQDEFTKVIVCYLESIDSGDAFVKAAEAAADLKPVVVFKAGTTAEGVKAASSHTGSLAGADIAYGAAFKRAGVIRADNFESLLDYAMALSMQPLPRGERVAIITNAGGPGIMATDAVVHHGLKLASLGHFTATSLKNDLPRAASVGNPIDVLGDADPERYATAIKSALDDDEVDAVFVILTPQAMTHPAETAKAIAGCVRKDKPILASFMGGLDVEPARNELMASSLPDFPSPERVVAAFRAMCDYAAWNRRPPRIVTRFPVNRHRVERVIHRYTRGGLSEIGEVDAKAILRAYDMRVPPGHLAVDPEEAIATAERVGYPVAMKIVSPDIIHKTDVGGVRINLNSPQEVRDSFELMMLRIPRRIPNANLVGVYVEKMCPRGREVILGMSRDPQFGPMLMFGLGGILVEVMKDVTFHLAPITEDEAMRMLMGTKSYPLLKGARGQAGVDMISIARCLQRVSQLATDFPTILEMDINPLIVGAIGTEPVVADARMTLTNGKDGK